MCSDILNTNKLIVRRAILGALHIIKTINHGPHGKESREENKEVQLW